MTFAFCNVAAFERFDPALPDAARFVEEDFNRLWSDARIESSGQSTKLTVELNRARELLPFLARATHLLDLHSMHERGAPLLVTGTLQRNIDFAQALQTPAQVIIDSGHADGVRMRNYGAFADSAIERIALLLEAGQHWQASSVAVARNTLARFLIAAGAVSQLEAKASWPVCPLAGCNSTQCHLRLCESPTASWPNQWILFSPKPLRAARSSPKQAP